MRTSPLAYLALLGSVSLGSLAGCHDDPAPPTPGAVRDAITADLPHILTESKAAFDGMAPNVPTMPALRANLPANLAIAAIALPKTSLLGKLSDATLARIGGPILDAPATGFDPNASAKWLNENLFTDANQVEPGIYKVPASLVCATDDAACATKLDQAQLRIRVAQNDQALHFFVQLDANHDEPLDVTLSHDAVATTLDLDGMSAAMTALAPVLGASDLAMKGQVSARLEVVSTAHVKAAMTIDRDFGLVEVAPAGGEQFALTSVAADVLTLQIDGASKSGVATLGLGHTHAHVSPQDGNPSEDYDLPALTGTIAALNKQPLVVSQLSLGNAAATYVRDGRTAASISLNPDDGHAVSGNVTTEADGIEKITVMPKLDVRFAFDHAALGDAQPAFDVVQVKLDGSASPAVAVSAADELRVVSGRFTIATNPASFGLSIGENQCAAEISVDTDTSSYQQWQPVACRSAQVSTYCTEHACTPFTP